MHRGFVKEWRKELESDIWQMPPLYHRVWSWLRKSVNHETKCVPTRRGWGIYVLPGQRLTSIGQVAEDVSWMENRKKIIPHKQTIGRVLDWLVFNRIITVTCDAHGTLISIVNWDIYNGHEPSCVTDSVPASVRGVYTNKNDKNDKNKKESKEDIPGHPSGLHPLAALWNELVGEPRVTSCNKSRVAKANVRLKELSVDAWRDVMLKLSATPFLRGNNDRGWRADFDWLIANDTNHVKVMEGKYDRSGSAPKSREQFKQENNHDAIQKFLGGSDNDNSGQSSLFVVNG